MKTNIVHNVRYSTFQCKRGSGATLQQSKYPLAHKESYAFGSFGSPLKSYTSQVYYIHSDFNFALLFGQQGSSTENICNVTKFEGAFSYFHGQNQSGS